MNIGGSLLKHLLMKQVIVKIHQFFMPLSWKQWAMMRSSLFFLGMLQPELKDQDIQEAYSDLSQFRQAALPNMAATILEMDEFAAQAEETINKMESSKQVEQYYGLDIVN